MSSNASSVSAYFKHQKLPTAPSTPVGAKQKGAKLTSTPVLLTCSTEDLITSDGISRSSPYFCNKTRSVRCIDFSRFAYVPIKPEELAKQVRRDLMKMDENNLSINYRSNDAGGLSSSSPPPRKKISLSKRVMKAESKSNGIRNYGKTTIKIGSPYTPKRCKATKTSTNEPFSSPTKTSKSDLQVNLPTISNTTAAIVKRAKRKRQRIEPGSLTPPPNWKDIHALVRELREDGTAPIDSVVYNIVADRHKGERIFRFQNLIALMLSSKTQDGVVAETMRVLRQRGLDRPETILATSDEEFNNLIWKVGFHNKKTIYIKQVSQTLIEKYDGDIPHTVEEMMKLPGVGPKMAYRVENYAFGTSSGLGIDTHMHRLFNDLGWVNSKTPEQTREQMEGWLPQEYWNKINILWVGFGQESQQHKERTLRKALSCSRPFDALELLKRVGMDIIKEGRKHGLEDEIDEVQCAIFLAYK